MTERHALVRALIDELPETNTVWPPSQRALWLQAAASIFDLVYGRADGVVEIGKVHVTVGNDVDVDGLLSALNRSSGKVLTVEPVQEVIEVGTEVTYESEPERKDVILESTVAPDRNVGGRSKMTGPARPAGIPTNLNMALDAIEQHEGKASASQILAYVRRKYWNEAPNNWTASLYDQVNSKKLSRDGINFVRPAEPKIEQKPVAPVAAPIPHENRGIAQSDLLIRFEYGGKSAMLSKVGFRVAEALRRAMGKGHLDYAYLMQAGTAGQQRKAGLSEKVWCMEAVSAVRPHLASLGLEITHSPEFGYTMHATAVD